MSAIFKFILQGVLCLLASTEVGFGAPASKIMEPSSGNVTVAQTPEKKASDSAITRIAFLGDSITEGVGVKEKARDRYASVATRLLAGKHPGITEINLGKSGRALC